MNETSQNTYPASVYTLDSSTDHSYYTDGYSNSIRTSTAFWKLDNESFFMGGSLLKSGTVY